MGTAQLHEVTVALEDWRDAERRLEAARTREVETLTRENEALVREVGSLTREVEFQRVRYQRLVAERASATAEGVDA